MKIAMLTTDTTTNTATIVSIADASLRWATFAIAD
jgi:hypothetical protein